jgi:uncharacterized protein (DUF952 family)
VKTSGNEQKHAGEYVPATFARDPFIHLSRAEQAHLRAFVLADPPREN